MSEVTNPISLFAESPWSVAYNDDTLRVDGYRLQDVPESRRIRRLRRGWLSSPGVNDIDEEVVVHFSLGQPRLINRISFKVARVPCNWKVEYLDDSTGTPLPVMSDDGQVLKGTVTTWAKPGKDAPAEAQYTQFDARGSGSWIRYRFNTTLIRTSTILITFDRKVNLRTLFGMSDPTAYSVGLKDVNFVYLLTEPLPDDERVVVRNVLGLTEKYRSTSQSASLVLDGQKETYWISGPQPYVDSIAALYADIRDNNGNPRFVDRVWLDPVWPGPRMTIYYSNDDTVGGDWYISDRRVQGTLLGVAKLFEEDGLFINSTDRSSFPMTASSFDIGQDWAVGFVHRLNTITGTKKLWFFMFDTGASASRLGFYFDMNSNSSLNAFRVGAEDGTVFATFSASGISVPASLSNKYVRYVLSYSWGQSGVPQGWYLYIVGEDGQVLKNDYVVGTPPPVARITSIYVGGDVGGSFYSAEGRLRHFWIRQDSWWEAYAQTFALHPYEFVNGIGVKDRTNGHYRCVFLASFYRDVTARIGPGAGWWEAKEWTPVPRDYVLRRGVFEVPGITAKYVKFEFTGLVRQPFVTSWRGTPVLLEHRTFPDPIIEWYKGLTPKQKVFIERFGFQPVYLNPFSGELEAEVPRRSDRRIAADGPIAGVTGSWSSLDDDAAKERRHALQSIPMRFQVKGRHQYVVRPVAPKKNEAYFVGLREVSLYRSRSDASDTAYEYVEHCEDSTNISPSTTMSAADGAYVATAPGQVLLSRTFTAAAPVRFAQFAAVTSDWWSRFTNDQIYLRSRSHLTTVNSYITVTASSYGNEDAQVLIQQTVLPSDFGVRTAAGIFVNPASGLWDEAAPWDSGESWDAAIDPFATTGSRVSAFARVFVPPGLLSPKVSEARFRLSLYQGGSPGTLVASKTVSLRPGIWYDIETAYVAQNGHQDWTVSIQQLYTGDNGWFNGFVLAALGIFMHSVHWELSNDGGTTWVPVLRVNDPDAYVRFPSPGNQLVVRATAIRPEAVVSAYHLVPWYDVSPPFVYRRPVDYSPPWGISEQEDLRAVKHKPMFRQWAHFIPQRFAKYPPL